VAPSSPVYGHGIEAAMIDMSTWEELRVDVVNGVHLDPHNVRLDLSDDVPESDIVQDLFANEKALNLVEGITKVGLLTHEVPIVVERGGELVVVEGNRRVAALKAIQNPYLAPEHQSRIARLFASGFDRDTLRYITVKKAPSQDDADQLIAALHTGNQRVAWSPARQAAFFQAQLDAGKTADQLANQYPTIDVRKFITRSVVLELFRNVEYDDPALKDYARKRRFPVSTLARLYDNDKFLSLIGVAIDNDSSDVTMSIPQALFQQVATKIISDIRDGKINTRSLNKTSSERYIEYLDEIRDLIDLYDDSSSTGLRGDGSQPPKETGANRADSGQAFHSSGSARENVGTATNGGSDTGRVGTDKPTPFPPKRNYLSTENLTVPTSFPPAIHQIANELAAINIQRFPNASLDLLRTFLEKSIKAYAEVVGEDIRKGSQDQGFVFLGNCLTWLEEHFKTTGKTAYIQPLQKIRGGRYGFVGSKSHLDATNHNHHIVATPDDVRECWASIEGVLRAVLK
jgi:hypothetical protein